MKRGLLKTFGRSAKETGNHCRHCEIYEMSGRQELRSTMSRHASVVKSTRASSRDHDVTRHYSSEEISTPERDVERRGTVETR